MHFCGLCEFSLYAIYRIGPDLGRRMRDFLDARGYANVQLCFPPRELCTDNAAMIAWTGLEMYETGWESNLKCRALRKWSIDPSSGGGILGADNWERRHTCRIIEIKH